MTGPHLLDVLLARDGSFADAAAGRLVAVFDGWRTREAKLRALVPSRRLLSARVRAFIDLLVERLPEGLLLRA